MALGDPVRLHRKTQLEVNDLLLKLVIACVVNAFRAAVILSTIVSVTARFFEGSFHLCLFPVCPSPVFLLRNRVWLVTQLFNIHAELLKAVIYRFECHSKLLCEEQVVLLELVLLLPLQFVDLMVDFKIKQVHVLVQLFVSLDGPVRFRFNSEQSRLVERWKN